MWQERVVSAFPELASGIVCFGFDWLGDIFALDVHRLEEGELGVLMFEPGTGEALNIPCNLQTFHNKGVIELGEAVLALSFFARWRESGGAPPAYEQCIGYKKPLFLGGADEVENLEMSDLDVYWRVMGQLISQVKKLPPGTPINKITIG
jgi:hypothetical protein